MSGDRRFRVTIRDEYFLTESEVWPDGEGPLDPTAFDVAQEMGNGGSVRRVLEDWNMNEPSVRVDGVTVEFT